MIKFKTLLKKELLRFYKVGFQTLAAPILTSMLYLFVFSHILSDRVEMFDEINYVSFLTTELEKLKLNTSERKILLSSVKLGQTILIDNIEFN